jgi:hypothetical protein
VAPNGLEARQMQRLMLTVLLGGLVCAVASAAQTVVIDSMEDPSLYTPAQPELHLNWKGTVALETADYKEGKGCLRFDIHSAKSGEESYPQWGRSFDPAKNDWTRYSALRYWVKVTSNNPTVTFKNMCVVVYNGDAPLQQFQVHQVPVGRWVQCTDLILNYNRDKVRGIVIYLYETDPTAKDDYTWLIDGMEVLGMEANAVGFDTMVVSAADRRPTPPLRNLGNQLSPRLTLDSKGRVSSLSIAGGPPHQASRRALGVTGLQVRDWRRGDPLEPVEGKVTADRDGLSQRGQVCDGLEVSARYRSERDALKVSVTVHDTRPEDRPVTVYFAVPLQAKGWQWWDDVARSRPIEGDREFLNNNTPLRLPPVSGYPFCCVSNDNQALSLAAPIIPPRLNRMVYSASLGLLYIAYDFCLTPAATKQKQTE